MNDKPVPPQQGDEAELFRRYNSRLEAIIRRKGFSADVVEDASAFTWAQFLRYRPHRDSVLPWLITVARREAIQLTERQLARPHTVSADPLFGLSDPRDGIAAQERIIEARERLAELPARDRRAAILRGLGYTFDEVGGELGVSSTRAQVLAERGVLGLRRQEVELREADGEAPPRVKLLNELKREPPPFLRQAIGRFHGATRKGGAAEALEWSRLAMRIVNYRIEHGVTDPVRALGVPTREDDADRHKLEHEMKSFNRSRRRNGRER